LHKQTDRHYKNNGHLAMNQLFALRYGTPVCPVCNVGVLWPNGWMDQDVTCYGGRPRPRWHCVTWGPSSQYGKGHSSPLHFSVHVYCG